MTQCNANNLLNFGGDSCTWIVLLVGAYFFLSNGCVGNIFDNCDNSVIWIIILFVLLYLYNCNNKSC